jgi:hypothetical protein
MLATVMPVGLELVGYGLEATSHSHPRCGGSNGPATSRLPWYLIQTPHGHLTNSDLEMAQVLLHESVLEAAIGSKMQAAQLAIGCLLPIAFGLLRGFTMRQRVTRSVPPAVFHLVGKANILADVASRHVAGVAAPFHLLEDSPGVMCPNMFLTHFKSLYPLPQHEPWHNVQPPSNVWSCVISTLHRQPFRLQQWMMPLNRQLGPPGPTMPDYAGLTPGCDTFPESSNKHTSLPLPPGFDLGYMGMQSKLEPKLWKKPSITLLLAGFDDP